MLNEGYASIGSTVIAGRKRGRGEKGEEGGGRGRKGEEGGGRGRKGEEEGGGRGRRKGEDNLFCYTHIPKGQNK